MKYSLLLLATLFSVNGFCQSLTLDTTVSAKNSNVRFFEDPSINILLNHQHKIKGKVEGYRIQIYNGLDRQKAQSIKRLFDRTHEKISSYFSYHQPNFRVRVGDFPSRKAAIPLFMKLHKVFTCMIVPTMVNIK